MNGYENFMKLVEENGMKVKDVSIATKIAPSTFSDWKNGRSVPKLDKLIVLANYFDVDVEYLAGQSDIKKKIGLDPKELEILQEQGDVLYEQELNEALKTITDAIKKRPALTNREKRLLQSYELLSDDMQDSFLAMLESTVKNIQQKP
jgi:repressor LexA